MSEKQAGLTALAMAYARAFHARHVTPKIFDDFLAESLFTPEERDKTERDWASTLPYLDPELAAANPDLTSAVARIVALTNGPITLPRSRYAEDRLAEAVEAGARQYVILGAGLDTFAWRRPDLADRLQIFEVDHPATQALKRERVERQPWGHPANLHYVAADLAQESLADALRRSPFDPAQRSFFGWLGVTYYLTREVVFETLRGIASISAPGDTVVFDYLDADAFDPAKVAKRVAQMIQMASYLGEPMKAAFEPSALAAELAGVGLRLEENLDPAAIEARYFQGRTDGYHAVEHFHYARAVRSA